MSELVPIFVVWTVFYYTYKLIGLYARRKERLLMIEKMNAVGDVGIDDKELFAHSFTACGAVLFDVLNKYELQEVYKIGRAHV